MKLVVGLGNPGRRYQGSRHNVGFMVIDELARRWKLDADRYDRHFEAACGSGTVAGQATLLLRPATFMNLSGRSVSAVRNFYKLAPEEGLFVFDDLDLPLGKLRLRARGSSGGHRGMEDVIRHLGTEELARLRVGIGKVHKSATVEYVLSRFDPEEQPVVEQVIRMAADAVECWLRDGIDAAMNEFNRRDVSDAGGGASSAPQ